MTADIIRWLVITGLVLTSGATLTVLRLHYRAWRKAPAGSGLTPLHVVLIAVSHLGFVMGAGTLVLSRLREDQIIWQTGLFGFCSALTLVALFVISRVQVRKVRTTRSSSTTTTNVESSSVEDR